MIVNLSSIFFYIENNELENNISNLLTQYKVIHEGFYLYNDDKSLYIIDDEGNNYLMTMLSNSKRSFHPVDVVNILTQFYVKQNSQQSRQTIEFIKDCCDILLIKINLPLFKFESLYTENDCPCIKFQLSKNSYKIIITNSSLNSLVSILKLFILVKNNDNTHTSIALIKSKPLKLYGNPYIDILYQMILYAHYFISYIKGNSTWDNI